MGLISDIFGAKTKTKSESTQTVTPQPMAEFKDLFAALGPRALQLLQQDPQSFVAGLSQLEGRGVGALENLIGDDDYSKRMGSAFDTLNVSNTDARTKLMNPYLTGAQQIDPSLGALNQQFTNQTVNTGPTSGFYGAERVSTSPLTSAGIQSRMSPYIESVLNPALQEFDLQQGIQSAGSRARRAGQKAFGDMGERGALMEDYLSGLQRSKVTGDLLQKGFESATSLATGDEDRALRAALANQQTSLGEQGLIQGMDQSGQEIRSREAMSNQNSDLERQRLMLTQGQGNQQSWLSAMTGNQDAALRSSMGNQSAYMTGANAAGQIGNQAATTMGALSGQNMNTQLGLIQALFGAGATQRDVTQRGLQAPWTALTNASNIAYGSPVGQTGTASGTGSTTATPSLFDIGSGIARAGAGMSFARGGRVPYAGGGLVDEEEPPIPEFDFHRTSRFGRKGIGIADDRRTAGWPKNDDMYAQVRNSFAGAPLMEETPDAALAQANPAPPQGRGRFNFNEDRSINWGDGPPVESPSAFSGFMDWVNSTTGPSGARASIDIDPSVMGDEATLPTREVGRHPGTMPLYEQSNTIPAPERGALETTPSRELMGNTLAALQENVKKPKSFLNRMGEFLKAPSTAESFGIFSPGWAALADRNLQRDAKNAQREIQMLQILKPDAKEKEIQKLVALGLSEDEATKLAYNQAGEYIDPLTRQKGGFFDNVQTLLNQKAEPRSSNSSVSRSMSGASPFVGPEQAQAGAGQGSDKRGIKPILSDVTQYGGTGAFSEWASKASMGIHDAGPEVNETRQNYRMLQNAVLRAKGANKLSNQEAERELKMLPDSGSIFEDPNRAYDILSTLYRDMIHEMEIQGQIAEDQSEPPELRRDARERFLGAKDAITRIGNPEQYKRPSVSPKGGAKMISTQEEYDALPSGTRYRTEDGEAVKP